MAKKLLNTDISQENALSPVVSLFTEKISPKQQTYLEMSALVSLTFDYQNTLDGLADSSIVCPPVSFKLLSTYFSFYIRSGFLPHSKSALSPTQSGVFHKITN